MSDLLRLCPISVAMETNKQDAEERRYLEDVLETMGPYVDSLKFAGGSFALIQPEALEEIIATAHAHDVLVSGARKAPGAEFRE